jgi:hypothetical protein
MALVSAFAAVFVSVFAATFVVVVGIVRQVSGSGRDRLVDTRWVVGRGGVGASECESDVGGC